ncbi:MAG: elongation factor P [Elusimicrobia bacterium]|nr:elongation factor P [Elusimicrobiota bacterium]
MISTTDFREGLVYEDDGHIVELLKYQHHRMSQSKAVVRVKIRNLETGAVLERSYPSGEKFRDIEVRKREKTYLYSEGDMSVFMDDETYEQVSFPKEKLGDQSKFLTENMHVLGVYVDDKLTNVELPASVELTVTSTVPGVKGDSVANMVKPATLETGIEINVPLFIKEGEKIKVDTRTGEYLERA